MGKPNPFELDCRTSIVLEGGARLTHVVWSFGKYGSKQGLLYTPQWCAHMPIFHALMEHSALRIGPSSTQVGRGDFSCNVCIVCSS